ncbi:MULTISPECIES: hypothetical protein [Pseudomonas]|uniref:Uncharacterized protein n=1 Tax=Pseudomonas entomophila TaxID=312306 RepID=A0A3S8UML8_9PSED|nr:MULTISPECIES: hypothetical protein [Pseudomonas]AZL69536.1 hypothetical protein EJA05_18245 [Pseudomonas oryziphila]UVK81406.1 hypothetical protein LOY46_17760 [Pseudomonas sichuanensis]UVL87594.1 hypothetical protein LOY51_17620 [Pseudomonas sichuanensis]
MSELEKKLQHLTAEQIEVLYAQYLAGEKVSVLLDRYAIDLKPTQLIKALPPRLIEDLICPYCNTPLFQRRPAKSALGGAKQPAFCSRCEHQHHFPYYHRPPQACQCSPCQLAREQARLQREAELRQRVQAFHGLEAVTPVPFSSLSLTHKLQLMALFEARSDWRLDCLLPARAVKGDACIAPSEAMEQAVLQSLREAKVLMVDPTSPLDAFDSGPTPTPRFDRVYWRVNVSLGDGQRTNLADLYRAIHRELSRGPMPAWREEIAEAIHTLALEEVYGYLESYCAEHSLPFQAWKKGREVIAQLLEELPVCQVWYLAKLAVNNAVVYFNKGSVSKTQASNGIPNSMLALGQKAVEGAWTTKWHKHSVRSPRSGFSKALHDLLLKHDDYGRERRIGNYITALPSAAYGPGTAEICCSACGSLAIHVQTKVNETIVNCKDCMARSLLPTDGHRHLQ